MEQIIELKRKRFMFLETLYNKSGGDEHNFFNMFEIGKELGFDYQETKNIVHYLDGEGLTKFFAIGGEIVITHYGIVEIERALSNPEESTTYFPPVSIINIHHMENSQIQQGNINSKQIVNLTIGNNNNFKDFIEILKRRKSELKLDIEDEKELDAEISTIEAQLNSSKPKKNILLESIGSLTSILESAAGSILATELLPKIPLLLSLL
ncbi:MAG: hypothetical protein Q8N03_04405 [Ignavibacteria bacterium]|nr:hypothetical protein [Ignavibacteria bacterium]